MSSLTCNGCVARERQLTDLRQVIGQLQRELRARLGRASVQVIDAMEGQAPLTAAEIAKRAKLKDAQVTPILMKLRKRGFIKRTGWREITGRTWPAAEFQIVSVRETTNGSAKGNGV